MEKSRHASVTEELVPRDFFCRLHQLLHHFDHGPVEDEYASLSFEYADRPTEDAQEVNGAPRFPLRLGDKPPLLFHHVDILAEARQRTIDLADTRRRPGNRGRVAVHSVCVLLRSILKLFQLLFSDFDGM